MDNKEILKGKFACGATPTDSDFASLIDSCVGNLTDVLQLPTASSSLVNTSYKIGDKIYTCKLQGGVYQWVAVNLGGGGGTSYSTLSDKPSINSVVLGGNKTLAELGILSLAGYGVVTPQNTDVAYILRNGTPQMVLLADLIGNGGVNIRYNVTDYANPYTFVVPAGATRANFRFLVDSSTYIEHEVGLENGNYSVIGHDANDASHLLVVNYSLTYSAGSVEISIVYGSWSNADGFVADKDGVIELITFR